MAVSIPGVQYRRVDVGGHMTTCQVVHCSSCTNILPVKNNRNSSLLPEEVLKKKAEQQGWAWEKKGRHICPTCLEANRRKTVEVIKKPAPKVIAKKTESEEKERTMTRDDRRRIWRAVDDAYDPTNERYQVNFTDAAIAKAMKVPVEWVEGIRDSDFGPAGVNEDMTKLRAEIQKALKDLNESIDGCFKAAEKADEKRKDLVDLERRVARVEASVSG